MLEVPTPIQSQAIPIGFSGKDLIGISPPGSGKTFSYLIPLIFHALKSSSKPSVLILSPTRELAD